MRRLIADLYKIIFKATGSKIISLPFAVAYVSALNLLTIYGLLLLTEDLLPEIVYALRIFAFPYIILTSAIMLSFNFYIMLPLHRLSEELIIKPAKRPIIIYSIVSALLFGYTLLVRH